MSKYEPKNREEAFVYQFDDDIRVLGCLAQQNDKGAFEKGLQTLEAHIAAYRNKNLRRRSENQKKKSEERELYMKKHYPQLYK